MVNSGRECCNRSGATCSCWKYSVLSFVVLCLFSLCVSHDWEI